MRVLPGPLAELRARRGATGDQALYAPSARADPEARRRGESGHRRRGVRSARGLRVRRTGTEGLALEMLGEDSERAGPRFARQTGHQVRVEGEGTGEPGLGHEVPAEH